MQLETRFFSKLLGFSIGKGLGTLNGLKGFLCALLNWKPVFGDIITWI